ncbi:hypothetical protein GURASL_19160 [Geotalea uraniireducens]|uniref:4Fe-4S ferredoxin-type domain-containing protein n=1 Tax=Geotalea uraniireducens TaxID=351604 RepID=A0ABN6VRL2_9BACT|nr:DUF1653 domain-containing protein [Geotalea uraniireducens]BDV42993.1 hypothetical protein GURASL_19160 [Geotalea uraniireducens]
MNDQLQPGIYRHYTGKYCRVLSVARERETGAELVVYTWLAGDRLLRVRPPAQFIETVTVDGRPMPRFVACEGEGAVMVEPARCKGCGRCVAACGNRLLSLESRGGRKVAILGNSERCDRCGRCVAECLFGAISVPAEPVDRP